MQTGRGFAQVFERGVVAGLVSAIICFTGGASAEGPLKVAGSQLEPVPWTELAGWTTDDHLAAFAAYQTSCQALRKTRRTDDRGDIHAAMGNACRNALALRPRDAHTARSFFEQNFQAVRIARLGEREGLLTGYFEPIVEGSRFPSPEFHVPVYRRPRDLVAAGYKSGSVAFPNKGVRISRRSESGELVPYHDRGAIEAGALNGQNLEICWLKDPLDLLAIQMEGSGRVILEDGTPLRISYDSHNGYSYSSIERVLVERNVISRQEMSPQRIGRWMAAYPEEAAKVRATNRAYVFFRITGLSNEGEPVGAQGVPLTPGRSVAVDRLHEYGTPIFIEANLPIESAKSVSPFGRLMIAQDTGSAIVGPARADVYWGAGEEAGRIAGRIRHPGRFAILLPRELDLIAAGRDMPLPAPKPKIADLEVTDGKGGAKPASEIEPRKGTPAPKPKIVALDVKKQDGKGGAKSASELQSRKDTPSPASKPKIAALDVKKQDGKGNVKPAGEIQSRKVTPSPAPKTKIASLEVKTQDGKGSAKSAGEIHSRKVTPSPAPKTKIASLEVKKQDGKGSAKSASEIEPRKGTSSPAPKPKIAAVDVKKQDGKGSAKSASEIEPRKGTPAPAPKPKIAGSGVKKPDGKDSSANGGESAARKPAVRDATYKPRTVQRN
jgi:membrane-bound lytic murein transglycosylase A